MKSAIGLIFKPTNHLQPPLVQPLQTPPRSEPLARNKGTRTCRGGRSNGPKQLLQIPTGKWDSSIGLHDGMSPHSPWSSSWWGPRREIRCRVMFVVNKCTKMKSWVRLDRQKVIYAYKCPFGPIQSLSLVMKPSQITIVHHRVGPVERRVGRNFPPQNSRKKCKKRTRFGLSKGIKRKSMVLSNIWNRSIDQITSVCHAILLLRMQRQITIFP